MERTGGMIVAEGLCGQAARKPFQLIGEAEQRLGAGDRIHPDDQAHHAAIAQHVEDARQRKQRFDAAAARERKDAAAAVGVARAMRNRVE